MVVCEKETDSAIHKAKDSLRYNTPEGFGHFAVMASALVAIACAIRELARKNQN